MAVLVAFWSAGPGAAGAPERVVSINICTDQLAMLLAGPGQLISVSYLATDPRSSAMAEAAADWPANSGGAEEVYLLDPDLVLAGSYTTPDTVSMLRRLGIRVETFAPVSSLDGIRAQMLRMGELLGREAAAAAAVADFDRRLEALRAETGARPGAVIYSANGYTPGAHGLSNAILTAAGYRNLAAEAGYGGGKLPLELLAFLTPDLLVEGQRYPGTSRAEAILAHPALDRLGETTRTVTDHDWMCGTPFALRAAERLARLREDAE